MAAEPVNPPHLAGVLNSAQIPAGLRSLPPPPSSAGLRHSADRTTRLHPTAHGTAQPDPLGSLGAFLRALGALLDAVGTPLDEFCVVLELFLHSFWSKFAEFDILDTIFTESAHPVSLDQGTGRVRFQQQACYYFLISASITINLQLNL